MTTREASSEQSALTPLAEIAIVVAISAAAFAGELILADVLPWGAEARGVLAVLLGALGAIWLTLRRSGSLAPLGLKRPTRWWPVPLWVVGILVAFILAQNILPALIAPFFNLPPPDFSRYAFVYGNPQAALLMAVALPLFAAVPEELLYRGFLLGHFLRRFGPGRGGVAVAVISQAVIFGLVHFQWGLGGIVLGITMGLVWGIAFLLCGRNLWIVIAAHASAHVLLVLQLYTTPPG